MRYSEIIGKSFYQINLPENIKDYLDAIFSASAHHYHTLKITTDLRQHEYHLVRHLAHLRELKRLVYIYGDFSHALDPSLRGLENRETWDPSQNSEMPDQHMFDSMTTDKSIGGAGQPHPCDIYLGLNLLPCGTWLAS